MNVPLEIITANSPLPLDLFEDEELSSEFLCGICNDIANPHSSMEHIDCGHVFCNNCIKSWIDKKSNCPQCKTSTKNSLRPIEAENKIIYDYMISLRIKCPTVIYSHACTWVGTWKELESHLSVCDISIIECPNHCGFKACKKEMSEHEITVCPNRIVTCGYCEKKISLKFLEEHKKYCEMNDEAIIPCKYFHLGCKFKGNKKDRISHEKNDVQVHIYRAEKMIAELTNKVKLYEEKKNKRLILDKLKSEQCIVSMHIHPLTFFGDYGIWKCCGNKLPDGCKSQLRNKPDNTEIRFRCNSCNFDLCYDCLKAYLIN